MIELLAIVGLALLWSVLSGTNTPFGLLVGALLGLALLSLIQRRQARSFPRRLLALIRFAIRFLGELVVANVTIARLAVSPRPSYHPHIIAVPLRVESDAAISLLSGAITVLPGTVAMGLSPDRTKLYAHAMGAADPEAARAGVVRIETLILGFMS